VLSPDSTHINVLIGADSILARRSGVGRMTIEIARAARMSDMISRVDLMMGGKIVPGVWLDTEPPLDPPPLRPIPWKIMVGRVPGVQALRRLKNGGLHRAVRGLARENGGHTVYHEPNMIAQPIHLPTVVTINDLSWHYEPTWHPAERLHWIGRNLPDTLRRARRFVAISQFTKDAAVRDLGIGAPMIDVVPLAPARNFKPVSALDAATVLACYDLADRRFVFSISTLEPRKNFDRLLTAFLMLPAGLRATTPLVIAGGKGWGEVLARPEAEQAVQNGSVRLLGHIPDADLAVLCARAGVFAYVSLYEGFGLPVVEAMAADTPIVASSTTAVGEIASGAALTVDPLDETAIAQGLRTVLEDPGLAERLRQSGRSRAAGYTWQRTVNALAESWRRAL